MSGGSFAYAYSHVATFADELEDRLNMADRPEPSAEAVRERLYQLTREARRVAALMKEAEWLYSGDSSETAFMRRVAEIEAKP